MLNMILFILLDRLLGINNELIELLFAHSLGFWSPILFVYICELVINRLFK
jgi:hypothetical protein